MLAKNGDDAHSSFKLQMFYCIRLFLEDILVALDKIVRWQKYSNGDSVWSVVSSPKVWGKAMQNQFCFSSCQSGSTNTDAMYDALFLSF